MIIINESIGGLSLSFFPLSLSLSLALFFLQDIKINAYTRSFFLVIYNRRNRFSLSMCFSFLCLYSIKAYYIIRRARKKSNENSFSLSLSSSLSVSLSLCMHNAEHNDLNYAHSTLIKEEEEEEEEREREREREKRKGGGLFLSFSLPLKKCYSNRDSQVEERANEQS
jgi:hypothetical protein